MDSLDGFCVLMWFKLEENLFRNVSPQKFVLESNRKRCRKLHGNFFLTFNLSSKHTIFFLYFLNSKQWLKTINKSFVDHFGSKWVGYLLFVKKKKFNRKLMIQAFAFCSNEWRITMKIRFIFLTHFFFFIVLLSC